MTRLFTELAQTINVKPLLTQQQLLSRLGQPHSACPVCGAVIFSVTSVGEEICWGCDYLSATSPSGIALRIIVMADPVTGEGYAADYTAFLAGRRQREFADAHTTLVERPARPAQCHPDGLSASGSPLPPRTIRLTQLLPWPIGFIHPLPTQTLDEFFKSLPIPKD